MHIDRIELVKERFPTLEHYPFDLKVLQTTAVIDLDAPVTFFIGENGTGKSTLLKAVALRCGIRIWQGEQRVRSPGSPYRERLYQALDVRWRAQPLPGAYFDSQIFRNFAQIVDEWAAGDPGVLDYFGGKSLLQQSHGQSLMAYFQSRFRIRGLYLLDEPETALSPRSQLALLKLLRASVRGGRAQFVIATHSPILLACPEAQLLSFDHAPLRSVEYEDTDAYRVYKAFMDDRSAFL